MKPEVDIVVIGAGVIGLACAAALARRGASVVILERNGQIALETTGRNSQVVHAGIYNPPGWLKSTLCVEGRHALVERCARWKVPYRRCGKLIVATEQSDVPRLEALLTRGFANGVEGLRLIDAAEVQRREPRVRAVAAIESAQTGIVDAVSYARSFQAEAEAGGAAIAFETEVNEIETVSGGYVVHSVTKDQGRTSVFGASVVNAAGLVGDRVAAAAGIDVAACGYQLHLCKGDYFALDAQAPVRFASLIYPLPQRAGLGVHATLDLHGGIRFGPDAQYVDGFELRVDPNKASAFHEAIRKYVPAMRREWLLPDYAGLRPKLFGPGEEPRDFVIAEESERGLPGFVNLLGIESPGLTAASAIANRVALLLSRS